MKFNYSYMGKNNIEGINGIIVDGTLYVPDSDYNKSCGDCDLYDKCNNYDSYPCNLFNSCAVFIEKGKVVNINLKEK